MVKVNFEDKQLNDENESIEKRYESTICDCTIVKRGLHCTS